MPFTEDQHMIQALASKRPDQTLNIWVLPRRSRCDRAVANPHRSDSVRECLPIRSIIVPDQIPRRRVPRKCLHDLLRQSLRRRVRGYREPQQPSSTMTHDKKRKKAPERQGRNRTEINRRNGIRMIAQECPPRLRWRSPMFGHVLGDRRFSEFEAKLEEFAVDARGAPQRIVFAHLLDELA